MFQDWRNDVKEMWNRLTTVGKLIIFPLWLLLSIVVLVIGGIFIVGPLVLCGKVIDGLIILLFKRYKES
jgi:hypothetical protein